MKKLIALLAIMVFCAMFIVAAGAKVTNPFSFSFDNTFKFQERDQYTPGAKTSPVTGVGVGDAGVNDGRERFVLPEVIIKATASTTIAQIYTLSFVMQGDWKGIDSMNNDQVRNSDALLFTAMMGNKFQVVKDYLAINLDISWNVLMSMNKQNFTTGAIGTQGPINTYGSTQGAPSMNTTGAGMSVLDRLNMANYEYYYIQQATTKYIFSPNLGLSGKVPNSGFDWSLGQSVSMYFDQSFWKDNDPTNTAHHGEPYGLDATAAKPYYAEDGSTSATANSKYRYQIPTVNYSDYSYGGFFESVYLYSNLHLGYEFLHYFAPENIQLSIVYDHTLGISKPIDYYYETDAEIMNDIKPALKLVVDNVTITAGPRFRTWNYYNTSAPINGTNGSIWLPNGSAVDSTKCNFITDTDHGYSFATPSHLDMAWRIGPQLTFKFTKGMAEFGGSWHGFWYHVGGDPDWNGQMNTDCWRNDFAIYAALHL